MKSVRVLLSLPIPLKRKLDGMKRQGYTVSGYIRALLEREFKQSPIEKREGKPWET